MHRRLAVLLGVLLFIAGPGRSLAWAAPCPPAPCGGSGGGGAGGAAGGGGGHPAGGLVVGELTLSRRVIARGATLEAEVTFQNNSQSPLAIKEIRIAARGPGATHAGGPYTDLAPALTSVTIPAGGHVTLAAERAFESSDPLGKWETYPTYEDASGWHDAASKYVLLLGERDSGGGEGSGGKMTVGTQEWFIAPWAGTTLFKSGINWSTAYSSGADIWNPQFLAELAPFVLFRHMDTNATNWSKIEHWSQRKQPNSSGNQEVYIDGSSDPDTTGLAVEWQIDMCNRAHVDCWFTHPYLADDDYLRQQAQMIKAKLSPNSDIYIELSNEVWNGGFSAYNQAIQAGQKIGVPGSNQYYQGIAHEMYRALQMYEIYQGVFGASAMGTRVIRVFSESGNLDLTTQALRNVYDSAEWNPHHQQIDMIALAPYVGNGQDGASEDLDRWKSEVDGKVRGEPIGYALDNHVSAYGVPLFGCYEAGMHHLQNADKWAAKSDAYEGYRYMLEEFATKMNGPCSLYTLHGTWDSGGAWGLYDHVGQALSAAPKARGTTDWIAGKAVTATTSTTRIIALVAFLLFVIAMILVVLRMRAAKVEPPEPPKPGEPPTL